MSQKGFKNAIEAVTGEKKEELQRKAEEVTIKIKTTDWKTYKNEKNILVIFSDMIEESGDYNFAKETLSEKRIQEIISKEKGKKRIPDLAGVKVYITGATATTSDKFFAVQNFWFIYFKECGATLAKENYGSALLSFKE